LTDTLPKFARLLSCVTITTIDTIGNT